MAASASDGKDSDSANAYSKMSMVAVMPPKEFLEKMYTIPEEDEIALEAEPRPKRKKKNKKLSEARLLKKMAELLDTRSYADVVESQVGLV